ncbi:MAG: ABC transporter ATP-binding protein [Eubacteriales bacterium]|nr:ABC transporter ATP-binding protein [Eubacteriales bacterium]
MISLEHVQKNYQNFNLDCSLEVPEGCITGLIGRNGAGKSTTFKVILGLIHIDGGRAEILGRPTDQLTKEDREQMGVVLADAGFSGYLMIKDLLPMLRNMYHSFDETGFVKRCEKFHLPLDKKIKDFSTGMKRKLQINAALSHDAKLLILDEPTAGLDVVAREGLLDMLREYMEQEGRSILISSHISTDLESFCDDFYLIDEGRIVLHEETDVLLSNYGILKLTPEQYEKLDKSYLLAEKKEEYGYRCLTGEKQFYLENYPDVVVEKGGIDELITMRERGEL